MGSPAHPLASTWVRLRRPNALGRARTGWSSSGRGALVAAPTITPSGLQMISRAPRRWLAARSASGRGGGTTNSMASLSRLPGGGQCAPHVLLVARHVRDRLEGQGERLERTPPARPTQPAARGRIRLAGVDLLRRPGRFRRAVECPLRASSTIPDRWATTSWTVHAGHAGTDVAASSSESAAVQLDDPLPAPGGRRTSGLSQARCRRPTRSSRTRPARRRGCG